jgi:hypothetical protein
MRRASHLPNRVIRIALRCNWDVGVAIRGNGSTGSGKGVLAIIQDAIHNSEHT